MAGTRFEPLPGCEFGVLATPTDGSQLSMKQKGEVSRHLREAWNASGGLMLIRAGALSPERLVSLARVFGEVEDCHETHVHPRMVSAEHSAIFRVTNELDPQTVSATATSQTSDRRPPASPTLTPHRGGGRRVSLCSGRRHHARPARRRRSSPEGEGGTLSEAVQLSLSSSELRPPEKLLRSCSFRWPPPDATLFYCDQPALPGQGDTLIADAAAAFDALPPSRKAQLLELRSVMCGFGFGRTEKDVETGALPSPREARPINSAALTDEEFWEAMGPNLHPLASSSTSVLLAVSPHPTGLKPAVGVNRRASTQCGEGVMPSSWPIARWTGSMGRSQGLGWSRGPTARRRPCFTS